MNKYKPRFTWQLNRQNMFLIVTVAFYFAVRIGYWTITSEAPFSDTADYVTIAKRIIEYGNFAHTPNFWLSYKPPTMPLIIATYFNIRGSYELDYWPFFQTLLNFGALVFLIRKLDSHRQSKNLGILFLLIFALSMSSIFWSLKTATEYCSETAIILICGLAIDCFQRKTAPKMFLLGAVISACILLRPQFMLLALIFPCALIFSKERLPTKIKLVATFVIAAILTWLPWGIRTYKLYGRPILTSTQGPYSFLWELGDINYTTQNGDKAKTNVTELQIQAPINFKNDYEAMTFASYVSKSWLKENFFPYIKLVPYRLYNTIVDTTEYLTKVPRDKLLPNWVNWILIGKNSTLIFTGILGLLSILVFQSSLWPICITPIFVWLMGIAFLSYPRVIDPSLPFIYAGNLFLIKNIKFILQSRKGGF